MIALSVFPTYFFGVRRENASRLWPMLDLYIIPFWLVHKNSYLKCSSILEFVL